MNHPTPLIAVPLDLSKLVEFLHQITQQTESHYRVQLDRYHNASDERQPDLWPDTDPPFESSCALAEHHNTRAVVRQICAVLRRTT